MEKSIFELSALDNHNSLWHQKKTVLVGGCFDLLHYGHLAFLKNAQKKGEILIVALESDEFISTYKKRKPVHNQQQRAEILASLRFVDFVIKLPLMNGNDSYFSLVKTISPAIIAVTEGDPIITIKQKQADSVGGQLIIASPSLSTFSTSSILSYEALFSD